MCAYDSSLFVKVVRRKYDCGATSATVLQKQAHSQTNLDSHRVLAYEKIYFKTNFIQLFWFYFFFASFVSCKHILFTPKTRCVHYFARDFRSVLLRPTISDKVRMVSCFSQRNRISQRALGKLAEKFLLYFLRSQNVRF